MLFPINIKNSPQIAHKCTAIILILCPLQAGLFMVRYHSMKGKPLKPEMLWDPIIYGWLEVFVTFSYKIKRLTIAESNIFFTVI